MHSTEQLRDIVLETLLSDHSSDWETVKRAVVTTARERTALHQGRAAEALVDEVLWDLIIERLVNFGSRDGIAKAHHPFIYLNHRGREVAAGNMSPHDPTAYLERLQDRIPNLDDIISQYILESCESFRRGLLFGAAVLCGAAAERAILLLLAAISQWQKNPQQKAQAEKLLEAPRLPSIYTLIDTTLESAAKRHSLPYSVHQGSERHLLSFQEMVRVQRNEAVHPTAATVSKEKIYLSLQTFPEALEAIERLRQWFVENQ